MDSIKEFIESNKERYLEELFGLIKIPTVSAKPEHKAFMSEGCDYVAQQLLKAGADKAVVLPTEGHPVVFGEKILDKGYKTVLIYGHYDVQPPEPLELWNNPPFEPTIIDGKIYARGADDDKGQFFMHVKAFELLNKLQLLKLNVKFIIEGEEEIGSVHLKKFCQDNKELLKADFILVSDTNLISKETPSITVGLRGLSYFEVEITGPNRDLHSGIYGGAVANPINVLAQMIAKLTDHNNKVTIPGFYDDVLDLSNEDRAELARAPFKINEYCKELDIAEVQGEQGYSTIERTGIRPSFDLNGIWGGYTGKGAKTVLPSKAYAKLSFRLVPNQDPEKISKLFTQYFESIAPKGVKVTITYLHGGKPYVSPTCNDEYMAASKAFENVFKQRPVPLRTGGSIPVIADFEEVLGIKTILMGFGLESDAIHSPNENFPLENFFKGIETISNFYIEYQKLIKI